MSWYALLIAYFLSRQKLAELYSPCFQVLNAFEKEPQDADDYVVRARCFHNYKFYEAAIEDYRTALAMEPNDDIAWYELAAILWRDLHRADEALPIIEKLSEAEGDYQGLAIVFHREILADKDPVALCACTGLPRC